jgi:hypothetical protein
VIVGGSGGSTSWALLLYVFLRENIHKLDAGVMGECGNLQQWVAMGYIGTLEGWDIGIFGTGFLNYIFFLARKKIQGRKKGWCEARKRNI